MLASWQTDAKSSNISYPELKLLGHQSPNWCPEYRSWLTSLTLHSWIQFVSAPIPSPSNLPHPHPITLLLIPILMQIVTFVFLQHILVTFSLIETPTVSWWQIGFERYRYWSIGYWPILAGIGWYWYRPNTFFSNRTQYWADNSLRRRLATHDDLISRNSL